MEVIITALIEYILTIEAKLSVVPNEMIAVYGSLIKKRFFFNLLLRNSGLLCFVGLVSDNFRLRIKILQDKERQLFREKHKLEVQQFFDKSSILLDEDEICYITQNQNYNTFVTVSGAKYTKRGTLNNLQDLLGENNYVTISRSVKENIILMAFPAKFIQIPRLSETDYNDYIFYSTSERHDSQK